MNVKAVTEEDILPSIVFCLDLQLFQKEKLGYNVNFICFG